MAAASNMGFHHDAILASALNWDAISFPSGAVTSASGMIPFGSSVGRNNMEEMILATNSSVIDTKPGITAARNSSNAPLLDSVPGLKHDIGLAVEWFPEEHSLLEEGLVKFADEPSFLRYIKIAATIRDKTVRDVALRCRWMTKEKNVKRRKPEDHYTGKKMKDRKEKLAESSSKANLPSAPPLSMHAYSPMKPYINHHDRISYGAPSVSSVTKHLLDENIQVFSQISDNLATSKIWDNINLFCRTRNNITVILNNMRDMPGIMSQMPPLPVSINEELANSILPNTAQYLQEMMFGSPRGIHLKQELGC